RRGRRRERLRGRRMLARHRRFRYRTLLDRPDGLAGHAVKYIEEALLARLRDRFDGLPIVFDGDQLWRSNGVVVPKIMVDELVVPLVLAGTGIERQQAVAVE